MLTPTCLITNQKNELSTLSLNHYYNASHYLLQVGTHSVLRQEPTVSPFVWQSNKAILFYFTQSYSFLFLSLRFDSVRMHEEAEILVSIGLQTQDN